MSQAFTIEKSIEYNYSYGDNFKELKDILINEESYPYHMDGFFDPEIIDLREDDSTKNLPKFTLFVSSEEKIVATYAARELPYQEYEKFFKDYVVETCNGTYYDVIVPAGRQWYSSCQWVHEDHRGQSLGIKLDRLKKDKIWELGGTLNYANCRDGLKEYHLKHLGYEKYQYQAHVPGGNIGGSGTVEDKKYYIIHESAPNPFF